MSKVLIANRGEIAIRIQRAAAGLGLRTVSVYTAGDREALHVRRADEAYQLDGDGAAAYLNADEIASAGRRAGCSLVHPGYGFLSEDPGFAALCAKAEMSFAGPPPELLELFGNKTHARDLAQRHGIPVLRATEGPASLDDARAFLAEAGPGGGVMVKALSGGGGRGIRAVFDGDDLPGAFARCRSEAERASGRGEVYVERFLGRAKHIEVQVLGDGQGNVIHLWDRECTVQRRHQKLIEIAPSPSLTPQARQGIIEAALTLARATGYTSLGTFEFLLDADTGEFFFIEANPRLQVEHPVTEAITGVDLVAAQLEVALGRSLRDQGLLQPDIPEPRGVAIQARVNLESIAADGSARPSTATVTTFEPPCGPGVRVDTHGYTGCTPDARFDSLLAKVITHRQRGDFPSAAAWASSVLGEFTVAGAETNIAFLRAVLDHPEFRDGTFTTTFVDDHIGELAPDQGRKDGRLVSAPFTATVVSVDVAVGAEVSAGQPLVVLEAMKMEHVLTAPASGVVQDITATAGETVAESAELVRLSATGEDESADHCSVLVDLDEIRPDLAEVIQRHETGLDAARPQAVERRRRTGQRTARENIDDLCDQGTFTEYGALAIAAQRQRRTLDDLIANTPADGMVTGIGRVNSETFGTERTHCVVMSYDYTVLAGTQGLLNHKKTDRMLQLAEQRQMPVVLFAEGGGGRPGDTDTTAASGLDVTTFATMARLSGTVPTIGIASGRCFAGNAALLGCCDVIIATRDATIGMGGPAMIEGGGLGRFRPEEVGPVATQAPNGVIDVVVSDESEAVRAAKTYLSYFQGPVPIWECRDQRALRHVIPENRVRVYDVRDAIDGLADIGSVLELRRDFGIGIITALIRVEGQPMGLVANNPKHLGGAIDGDAADKMARFLQLCDAHGLPVLSLCDTPGFMVGPEAEKTATVRHFSRLFVAGANLSVPVFCVVMRKGYGLGAQAMATGSFRAPAATVAWPTGEIGAMGLEGAVRLGYRHELESIVDPDERQARFDELLAESYDKGKAINAAAVFELDDVIDPAGTRRWIIEVFAQHRHKPTAARTFIDTW